MHTFYIHTFLPLLVANICLAQIPTPSPMASPVPSETGTTNSCISERQDCEQQAVGESVDGWLEEAEVLLTPMVDDCGNQPGSQASFCERMEYAICIVDNYNSATLASIFSDASRLQTCEVACRGCMSSAGGNPDDCSLSINGIVDSVLATYDNVEAAELELPALAEGCDWELGETEENTDCSTLAGRPEPAPPWNIRYYDEPLEYTCEIGDLAFTESLSTGAITILQLQSGYLYSSTCRLECSCVWQREASASCTTANNDCPTCSPLALGATRLDDVPVTVVALFGDPRDPADRIESACLSQTVPPCDSLCATSLTNYQTNNPPVTHTTDCTTWERVTPSPSPTASPQPSVSQVPSSTPTPQPSPTESSTETPSPSPSASQVPSSTPTPTPSPVESSTETPSPEPTPTPMASLPETETPEPTPSVTASPEQSATPTASPTPMASPEA